LNRLSGTARNAIANSSSDLLGSNTLDGQAATIASQTVHDRYYINQGSNVCTTNQPYAAPQKKLLPYDLPTAADGQEHQAAEIGFHPDTVAATPAIPQSWESYIGLMEADQIPFDPTIVDLNTGIDEYENTLFNCAHEDWPEHPRGSSITHSCISSSQNMTSAMSENQLSSSSTSEVGDVAPVQIARSSENADGEGAQGGTVDDITTQIVSRLGRLQIAEDGQPRYFGATSNLHILHNGPSTLFPPNIRNLSEDGEAAVVQAGLQWQEDVDYEDYLISLFFSWHNEFMWIVDKAIFLRERERVRHGEFSDLYSPTLVNSM
jgi:hypothetical protein